MKKIKMCIAASAGGHLSQMLQLRSVWEDMSVVCVSTSMSVRDRLSEIGPTSIVGECNRRHLLRTLSVAFRCLAVVLREKPDVVLSTGAAVGCLTCFLGRLTGAYVIWVDSIANCQKLSLSGRLIRRHAHLVLTQWPQVAVRYRNVEYAGELI